MQKQDLQFQIDQLRKDKIIYATEATATSITAMIILAVLSFSSSFLDISKYIAYFAGGYWLYAMIGNFFRLLKIKRLESQLK